MVTTIQLNENVKRELDRMKQKKESYEQLILNLMAIAEKSKREREELLIKGYEEMAEDGLRTCKEWEAVDSEIDWEWNENEN